mgnify:CR=1 FL=1
MGAFLRLLLLIQQPFFHIRLREQSELLIIQPVNVHVPGMPQEDILSIFYPETGAGEMHRFLLAFQTAHNSGG